MVPQKNFREWTPKFIGNRGLCKALVVALEEARRRNDPKMGVHHLLLGIMNVDDRQTRRLLKKMHINYLQVGQMLSKTITGEESFDGPFTTSATPKLNKVIHRAALSAKLMGDKTLSPGHILLAVLSTKKCRAAAILRENSPSLQICREIVNSL